MRSLSIPRFRAYLGASKRLFGPPPRAASHPPAGPPCGPRPSPRFRVLRTPAPSRGTTRRGGARSTTGALTAIRRCLDLATVVRLWTTRLGCLALASEVREPQTRPAPARTLRFRRGEQPQRGTSGGCSPSPASGCYVVVRVSGNHRAAHAPLSSFTGAPTHAAKPCCEP